MTASVSIHPQHDLPAGRYLLDHDGRLHPERFRGLIKPVMIVTVISKVVDKIRADCAAEAAEHAGRIREAKRLTTAHPLPVTPRPREIDRPLGRRKPATAPREPDEPRKADAIKTLKAAHARVRARQAVSKIEMPKIDGKAVAAAYSRKKLVPPAPKQPPTQRALSAEECRFCGIPGRKGCDHFLPYVEV